MYTYNATAILTEIQTEIIRKNLSEIQINFSKVRIRKMLCLKKIIKRIVRKILRIIPKCIEVLKCA